MKRWTLAALSAATVLTLAACSTSNSANTASGSTSSNTATPMNASTLNSTLQAYHWDLQSAHDKSGGALSAFTALAPKTVVRLNFMAGSKPGEQIIGTKICNNMSGGYQVDGNKLTVSQNLMATQMACGEKGVMQLEQAVGAQLPRAESAQVTQEAGANRLTLRFNDGSRWELKGVPTDATKYGGAGETIFLEVGPQLKPCSHGVMRNAQCMQVREVKYNQSGIKTGTGEWGHFYGNIDGFKHEAGMRNVLRVKRYTIQNPPADASRYAYVLDMRVESERVK